jgi:hypothetical protein
MWGACAEALEQAFQVGRQRHRVPMRLARDRMHEAQLGSVQGQAGTAADIGDRFAAERTSVHLVTAHGMAGFSQVNADLMGATGFQATGDEGVPDHLLEYRDVSDGVFAHVRERCAAAPPISSIA